MQDACRTHAACCALLRPAYRRTPAASGRNTSEMQAAFGKITKNAIDMKPACRLHVTLSVATSIEMQLSIPGVDALLRMQHPAAGRRCRLHAACMQGVDDALN